VADLLYQLYYAYHLYYVLPLLKAGAVIHALRAGVAAHWYFIIVFVPFGELIYFGATFWPEAGIATRVVAKRDRRPSRELRYAYEQNPSLQNQVALADRLRDEGVCDEAALLYVQALGRDPAYQRAHYGLASCRSELGDHAGALEHWRAVVEASRSYEEYGAWLGLARTLRALGRGEEAIAELEKLVAAAPRLAHVVEHAQALVEAGRAAEARELLERALRDHEHAPRHVRRGARAAARKAGELRKELAAS
jgi:hypothetical protein